jgi:uncharacterized protein (TIGR02996 family)
MTDFNFKRFLVEARTLPLTEERNMLLMALNGLIKKDWTNLLVYSDWLQDHKDPLGEYVQIIAGQIGARRAGRKWQDDPDRHQKHDRYHEVENEVYDRTIKRIKNWYYSGGFAHDEWSYTGPKTGRKRSSIVVNNLKFSRVGSGYGNDKPMSWTEVPTELLKAGLALHLRRNYHFDTAHHPTIRGARKINPIN